jgi:hypothetical protein
MHYGGTGVEQSYGKAMEWFRKASNVGHPGTQAVFGMLYLDSHGVEIYYSMAMEWFRKAGDAGDPGVQFFIGMMYQNGYGVKQSYIQRRNGSAKQAILNIQAPCSMSVACTMMAKDLNKITPRRWNGVSRQAKPDIQTPSFLLDKCTVKVTALNMTTTWPFQ